MGRADVAKDSGFYWLADVAEDSGFYWLAQAFVCLPALLNYSERKGSALGIRSSTLTGPCMPTGRRDKGYLDA